MNYHKDFATGTVAVAPSPADSGTTLELQTGEAARFPAQFPFYVTAHPDGQLPTLDNAEKLQVTAISGDELTIVRAQGDTTAKNIAVGWRISNAIFVDDIFGANALTYDEVPSGAVNGSNTAFSVSQEYVSGSLCVYVNGLRQSNATHVTEVDPSAGTFTLDVAPLTGDVVRVDYKTPETTAGNADTLDGYEASQLLVPAGTVLPFAGSSAPSGYLFCYGQAVSRSTYAALFAAISTTYGSGDGSTTFNLPDLRGRVVAGQDDMGGVSANRLTDQSGGVDGDVLGDTGGAETHTLTVSEMPAHSHSVDPTQGLTRGSGGSGSSELTNAGTRAIDAMSIGNTGGDAAHNNVQPTIILNYMIKV